MIRLVRIFFVVLACAAVLVGCDTDGTDVPTVEGPQEEIPGDKPSYIKLTDETLCFHEFIFALMEESSMISSLPEAQQILAMIQVGVYIYNVADELGIEAEELYLRRVTYLYPSSDQYGGEKELSAMALWLGTMKDGQFMDISPDRICLMEHFTITSDAECPSSGTPLEAYINGNSLVIMPDYIGYGSTADMVHPYMNHALCAINSVDALEAGYLLFKENSQAVMDAFGDEIVTLVEGLPFDHVMNCAFWMIDIMNNNYTL